MLLATSLRFAWIPPAFMSFTVLYHCLPDPGHDHNNDGIILLHTTIIASQQQKIMPMSMSGSMLCCCAVRLVYMIGHYLCSEFACPQYPVEVSISLPKSLKKDAIFRIMISS
ncbi:hypothetical protein G7K_5910-t1 [Saitoella complicata NRRL Y-17804]|uniref:Secreted protein n=1 Tax=Saitoella complicata (strain BCRC 22490 / CBS 7301 / JCM 7358 / NBRC 10748 / NRRL Y-17804) TaxID=698492 RepID=A0A0E9NPP8_SAICN|nr:hypothetical protein G7K_5910-t1 [Saitoella complicata NRRL Y-17804]